MGRFYETSDPNFVRDFVYTPPTDLFRLVAAKQQAYYDDAVNKISLLDSPVSNINYLNGEKDRENVAKKQEYYNNKVQRVLEAVQADPKNWRNNLGGIQELSKELQADLSTGELADIQGSYNFNQQWEKEHKKYKEKDPAYYEAMKKEAFKNYYESGGDSTKSRWQQETAFNAPDFEKYLKTAKDNLTAIVTESTTKAPYFQQPELDANGKPTGKMKTIPTPQYLTEQEIKNKQLNPETIQRYAQDLFSMDASNKDWVRQSQRLGRDPLSSLKSYLDAAGLQQIQENKTKFSMEEDDAFTSRQSEANVRRGQNISKSIAKNRLDFDYWKANLDNDANKEAAKAEIMKMAYGKDSSPEEKAYGLSQLASSGAIPLNVTNSQLNADFFELKKGIINGEISSNTDKIKYENIVNSLLSNEKNTGLRKGLEFILKHPTVNSRESFYDMTTALYQKLDKKESYKPLATEEDIKFYEKNKGLMPYGYDVNGKPYGMATFQDFHKEKEKIQLKAKKLTTDLFGNDNTHVFNRLFWNKGFADVSSKESEYGKKIDNYNNATNQESATPINPTAIQHLIPIINQTKSEFMFKNIDTQAEVKADNIEILGVTHITASPGYGAKKATSLVNYKDSDGKIKQAVMMPSSNSNSTQDALNNSFIKSASPDKNTYLLQNMQIEQLTQDFNGLKTKNNGVGEITLPIGNYYSNLKNKNLSVTKKNYDYYGNVGQSFEINLPDNEKESKFTTLSFKDEITLDMYLKNLK